MPQTRALPRIITRAIRCGNEAGRISIGEDTTAAKATFKPIPARKSTRSVLPEAAAGKPGRIQPERQLLGRLDRIRANG